MRCWYLFAVWSNNSVEFGLGEMLHFHHAKSKNYRPTIPAICNVFVIDFLTWWKVPLVAYDLKIK